MTMPALALVGASGRIQYCTEPFRARCEQAGSLCEELPELEAILSGAADRAVATLSGFETQIESVIDAAGGRCALLTLALESEPQQSAESPILREPLDDSPALVWLKDLEGRYTRVNSQFIALLGGSEAQLNGHTDSELPPAATVDGPRLQDAERTAAEPVEFGYTVPAYQDRPALSVLRFLIHGADGQPVGICGVAAPMAHSEIAENEAGRLMQLNRSTGLDPESIRSEILEEWGVSFGESFGPATAGHEEEWEAAPDPGGEVEEAEVAQYEVRQHLPAAPGPDPH